MDERLQNRFVSSDNQFSNVANVFRAEPREAAPYGTRWDVLDAPMEFGLFSSSEYRLLGLVRRSGD